jgi:hypothetical protein
MTRCHGWVDNISSNNRKHHRDPLKNLKKTSSRTKKFPETQLSRSQQITRLQSELSERKSQAESLIQNLVPDGPLASEQCIKIQNEIRLLASTSAKLASLRNSYGDHGELF